MRLMRAFFSLLLLAFAATALAQQDPEGARSSVAAIEAVLKQRPTDAALWFYMARLQSELGKTAEATAALEKVADLGDGFLPARQLGFEKAWGDAKFQEVVKRLESRLPRLDYAPIAFELEDRALLPEGIAFDAKSQSFFVGSTAKGIVLRVGWGNAVTGFAARELGLDSILGLAADGPRRILYAAATSALTDAGRTRRRNAVLAWDIDTGRPLRRVEVPQALQLNDVAVAPGGRIFASDSASGAIYEIPREGEARVLVPAGTIRGSNGLAASPDAKRLYVAHSTGIAVVEVASGAVKRVANETRENIAAIDGLYEYQGELVGVQNLTNPGRVIVITLGKDGESVARVRTLLSHHHNGLDEPTTGAVTDHGFFLLAATGVGHLNASGGIDNPDSVPKPTVVRVLLPR
jgi:hypothetical protein